MDSDPQDWIELAEEADSDPENSNLSIPQDTVSGIVEYSSLTQYPLAAMSTTSYGDPRDLDGSYHIDPPDFNDSKDSDHLVSSPSFPRGMSDNNDNTAATALSQHLLEDGSSLMEDGLPRQSTDLTQYPIVDSVHAESSEQNDGEELSDEISEDKFADISEKIFRPMRHESTISDPGSDISRPSRVSTGSNYSMYSGNEEQSNLGISEFELSPEKLDLRLENQSLLERIFVPMHHDSSSEQGDLSNLSKPSRTSTGSNYTMYTGDEGEANLGVSVLNLSNPKLNVVAENQNQNQNKSDVSSSNSNTSDYISVEDRERLMVDSESAESQISPLDAGLGNIPSSDSLARRATRLLEEATNQSDTSQGSHDDGESLKSRSISSVREVVPNTVRLDDDIRREDLEDSDIPAMSKDELLNFNQDLNDFLPKTLSSESNPSTVSEEVARLMAKSSPNDQGLGSMNSDSIITDGKVSFRTKNVLSFLDDTVGSMESQLEAEKRQAMLKNKGEANTSLDSDILTNRIQKVLSETEYLENGRKVVPLRSQTPDEEGYQSCSLDYDRLSQDLDDIQDTLKQSQEENGLAELNKQHDLSLQMSTKSTTSEQDTSQSKRLLWDYGADIGYDDSSGRFLGLNDITGSDANDVSLSPRIPAVSSAEKQHGQTDNSVRNNTNENPDTAENSFSNIDSEKRLDKIEQSLANHHSRLLQYAPSNHGLASRVFDILTQEPPQKYASSILHDVSAEEKELLKHLAERPKIDFSSADTSGVSAGSPAFHERDVRRHLELSELSSPGDMRYRPEADTTSRKVGQIASEAITNAQNFLSSQLLKMADQRFDKSVELRNPSYRNSEGTSELYGYDVREHLRSADHRLSPEQDRQYGSGTRTRDIAPWQDAHYRREAWNDNDKARPHQYYGRDGGREQDWRRYEQESHRYPYSSAYDPSEKTHSDYYKRIQPLERPGDIHDQPLSIRSRDPGDISSVNVHRGSSSQERLKNENSDYRQEPSNARVAPSTFRGTGTSSQDSAFVPYTSQSPHSQSSPSSASGTSPSDSDVTGTRKREFSHRYRPYRPVGSRETYYTESGHDDNASVTDSVTTLESTHTGSDDAMGPLFPRQYLGSRKEEPDKHPTGIYGSKQAKPADEVSTNNTMLSTIDEKSVSDDKDRHSSADNLAESRSTVSAEQGKTSKGSVNGDRGKSPANVVDTPNTNPLVQGESRDKPLPDQPSGSENRLTAPIYTSIEQLHARYADRNRQRWDENAASESARDPYKAPRIRSDPHLYPIQSREQSGRPKYVYAESLANARTKSDTNAAVSRGNRGYDPRFTDDYIRQGGSSHRQLDSERDSRYSSRQELEEIAIQQRERSRERIEREAVVLSASVKSDPGSRSRLAEEDRSHSDYARSSPTRQRSPERLHGKSRSEGNLLRLNRVSSPQHGDSPIASFNRSPIMSHSMSSLPPTRVLRDSMSSPVLSRVYTEKSTSPGQNDGWRSPNRVRNKSPGSGELVQSRNRTPEAKNAASSSSNISVKRYIEQPAAVTVRSRSVSPTTRRRSPEHSLRNYRHAEKDESKDLQSLEMNPSIIGPARDMTKADELPRDGLWQETQHNVQYDHNQPRRSGTRVETLSGIDNDSYYDNLPISNTVRRLQENLETEAERPIERNLDDVWQKYQASKQQEVESSLDNSRLEELANLLKNPTKHFVQQYFQERDEERQSRLQEATEDHQRRKQAERKRRKQIQEQKRKELLSSGSYSEMLVHPNTDTTASSQEVEIKVQKATKDKNNKHKRPMKPQLSFDSTDTLYSIAEDASFDGGRHGDGRARRKKHVIDPNMRKLQDKISKQREKYNKQRRREIRRLQKIQQLEGLLSDKRKGTISDRMLVHELALITSSSTAQSSSLESTSATNHSTTASSDTLISTENSSDQEVSDVMSSQLTENTVTSFDSSLEGLGQDLYRKVQEAYKKAMASNQITDDSTLEYHPSKSRAKTSKGKSHHVAVVNSTDSSIDVQYLRKSPKHSSKQKENKSTGHKPRMRDAATMYPSPRVVKQSPKRRWLKHMKSEAVQTSPGIRRKHASISPSRNDIPVIPVPLMSPDPKASSVKMFMPESPHNKDDRANRVMGSSAGLAWYVPLMEDRPWRKPLHERQLYADTRRPKKPSIWQPQTKENGVKKIAKQNQHKPPSDDSYRYNAKEKVSIVNDSVKPLSRLTLQEAFNLYKQDLISKSRERQKLVCLAAEERIVQEYLRHERENIFADNRKLAVNLYAHPLSDNLHAPKKRSLSQQEMKEHSQKLYKNLPEVVRREKEQKRDDEYRVNRLKASIFNKKVQRKLLQKAGVWLD